MQALPRAMLAGRDVERDPAAGAELGAEARLERAVLAAQVLELVAW